MESIRRQITLYVPDPERKRLEEIRQRFNPVQSALIPVHVTFCRDEDRPNWDAARENAAKILPFALRLGFGQPVREGNLVYLPVVRGAEDFHDLRSRILGDSECRDQIPHITLIHPRNGECTESIFREIRSLIGKGLAITFTQLTFIEQVDGATWCDLCHMPDDSGTHR